LIDGKGALWTVGRDVPFGAQRAAILNGKHFARFDHLTPDGLHAVAVLPSGEVWAVGPEGVATHSSDGRTFKGAQAAADLDALIALTSGTLVGAGRLGAIVQH
jgi:hypothetical protein